MPTTKLIAIVCGLLAVSIITGKVAADVTAKPQVQAQQQIEPTSSPEVSAQPLQPSPAPSPEIQETPAPEVAPAPEARTMPVLPVEIVLPGIAANIRAGPSINSQVKGITYPGQQVQIKLDRPVIQDGVTWLPVIAGEVDGWVASSLLSRSQMSRPGLSNESTGAQQKFDQGVSPKSIGKSATYI